MSICLMILSLPMRGLSGLDNFQGISQGLWDHLLGWYQLSLQDLQSTVFTLLSSGEPQRTQEWYWIMLIFLSLYFLFFKRRQLYVVSLSPYLTSVTFRFHFLEIEQEKNYLIKIQMFSIEMIISQMKRISQHLHDYLQQLAFSILLFLYWFHIIPQENSSIQNRRISIYVCVKHLDCHIYGKLPSSIQVSFFPVLFLRNKQKRKHLLNKEKRQQFLCTKSNSCLFYCTSSRSLCAQEFLLQLMTRQMPVHIADISMIYFFGFKFLTSNGVELDLLVSKYLKKCPSTIS